MPDPIILIGYFGFENLGDDLLLHTFLKRFKSFSDRFQIAVHKKYKINIKQFNRWNFIKFLFILFFQKPILVYPGGEIFQTKTSYRSLLYYISFIILARLFHRKYILAFQGQTKNSLAQKLFKKAAHLSIRDSIILPDAVFSLPLDNIPDIVTSGFIFCLKEMSSFNFQILKSVIVDLMTIYPDKPFYFLPMHRKEDKSVNKQMIKSLNSSQTIFYDWQSDYKKALGLFKKANFIFSMRYHASVLATLFQHPFVSFSQTSKITQFHKIWSPDNFIEKTDTLDFFEIKSKIQEAFRLPPVNISIFKELNEKEFQKIETILKG